MCAALGIRSAAYLAIPDEAGNDGSFETTDSFCYLSYTCYAPKTGVYGLLWNASIVGSLAMQMLPRDTLASHRAYQGGIANLYGQP